MFVLNRGAIKYEAKVFVSDNKRWWKMFLAMLPILLLSSGISISYDIYNIISEYGIQYFDDYYPNGSASVAVDFTSIIGIILIPFTTAMCGYFLNHIRRFNPDWRSLYKEGFDHYGKYFAVGFMRDLVVGLWSLLLIVPGIVKGFAYSQVDYIIHDNPNLSASEARKMSDIMTKGYKSDLFVLELSFFPWYMLEAITLGIAGIYVLPYYYTTKAMCYENLKKHAIDAGLIAPEAFGLQMNANPYDAPYDNFSGFNNGAPTYNGNQNADYGFVPTQTQSENAVNPDTVNEAAQKVEDELPVADTEAYEVPQENVTIEPAEDSFSGGEEREMPENKEIF